MSIQGKNILVTGGAARIGRLFCLALASKGANILLHYRNSEELAEKTKSELLSLGVKVKLIQGDLGDLSSVPQIIEEGSSFGPLFGLVNNASLFGNQDLPHTSLESWQKHMDINLTAPFLLSKSFAESISSASKGRIINILDWRALRPSKDHLAYTISKAGLAALTKSLAVALAPNISVNAIAFGAILPPSDGGDTSTILDSVPAKRWAKEEEIGKTLVYLFEGPDYITGETIHVDGGRHLI